MQYVKNEIDLDYIDVHFLMYFSWLCDFVTATQTRPDYQLGGGRQVRQRLQTTRHSRENRRGRIHS